MPLVKENFRTIPIPLIQRKLSKGNAFVSILHSDINYLIQPKGIKK